MHHPIAFIFIGRVQIHISDFEQFLQFRYVQIGYDISEYDEREP